MSFSAQVTEKVEIGGVSYEKANTFTDSAKLEISESVADSETDYEIACVLDVSEIACLYINSSQDVTLEINDGAGAGGSISLVADVPYIWHSSSYHTCLLAVNVTGLFVTNASGSAATFDLKAIYDSTP